MFVNPAHVFLILPFTNRVKWMPVTVAWRPVGSNPACPFGMDAVKIVTGFGVEPRHQLDERRNVIRNRSPHSLPVDARGLEIARLHN